MRAYSGEWEEGCAQVEIAAKLNPNHPGWYRFAAFTNAYRKSQYHEALEEALRINMPGFFLTYVARTVAYGQLGQREDAQKALKELLVLRPDFAQGARDEFAKWYAPEQVEQLIDGLRKAGLQVADQATIR
jgi:tetratricopeptide (TPR) repeat protein